MAKKKILLITNVPTQGNPALWYIYRILKEHYDIVISGSQRRVKLESKAIDYRLHSYLSSMITLLRIDMMAAFLLTLFSQKEKTLAYRKIILSKIRLWLNGLEFSVKTAKDVDFIINIDTEAAYISQAFSIRKRIPNAYFIYEFYAEQMIEDKDEFYEYRISLEESCIRHSNVLLSSTNAIIGEYLLHRYNISKDILSFSVCPQGTFKQITEINHPLKIYYHGALFDNRGIKEAILAMKDIEGAILYIRGFGYFENILRQTVIEHHLTHKVIFLEPVPTEMLAKAGSEFDLGISLVRMNILNHQYATGFKTFENISAGLALILPESYPLKKLNDDFRVGVTYKDATVENLSETFNYCVAHPEKVMEWKQNSRQAYMKEYNPDKQGNSLKEMIETLTRE